MNPDIYSFLLDLFPLADEIIEESKVLGEKIQAAGLNLLQDDEISRLKTMLRLARDLGYASPEVVAFLERSLNKITVSQP